MLRGFLVGAFGLIMSFGAYAIPYTGLYRTIDDETGNAKSIVMMYEYADGGKSMLGGRVVALYGDDGEISETSANASRVATHVDGAPLVVGMDIIWDMVWDSAKAQYSGGKIMDPANGKVYSSVIWDGDGVLNVRGKIGPFGRTQKWHHVTDAPAELKNTDTTNWKPITRK